MTMQSSDAFSIPKSTLRRLGLIGAGIVALAVIVILAILIARSFGQEDSLASAINPNEYQSVVLASGDVYFGKLSAPGGNYYYLRKVYHLVTQAAPRGGTPKRTLTKLTSDINSPEDLLVINGRQILFVENLNPSGQASRIMSGAGP